MTQPILSNYWYSRLLLIPGYTINNGIEVFHFRYKHPSLVTTVGYVDLNGSREIDSNFGINELLRFWCDAYFLDSILEDLDVGLTEFSSRNI